MLKALNLLWEEDAVLFFWRKTAVGKPRLDICNAGTLPNEWAADGAFPKLASIDLSYNYGLSGPLPDSWGNVSALPNLQKLVLTWCGLKGEYTYPNMNSIS